MSLGEKSKGKGDAHTHLKVFSVDILRIMCGMVLGTLSQSVWTAITKCHRQGVYKQQKMYFSQTHAANDCIPIKKKQLP
jgi:hypothetical protein